MYVKLNYETEKTISKSLFMSAYHLSGTINLTVNKMAALIFAVNLIFRMRFFNQSNLRLGVERSTR